MTGKGWNVTVVAKARAKGLSAALRAGKTWGSQLAKYGLKNKWVIRVGGKMGVAGGVLTAVHSKITDKNKWRGLVRGAASVMGGVGGAALFGVVCTAAAAATAGAGGVVCIAAVAGGSALGSTGGDVLVKEVWK